MNNNSLKKPAGLNNTVAEKLKKKEGAALLKISYLFIAASLLLTTACLSQAHPVKNQFLLKVEPPEIIKQSESRGRTLIISSVTTAAGFDNRGFVYRIDGGRFESDFYNEFFAPPARILADQTAQYLDKANSRFRVVKAPGLSLAQFGLESYLEEIYGDYSISVPEAVLTIRYTLNDLRSSSPKVLLDKTYHQTIRINGDEAINSLPGRDAGESKTLRLRHASAGRGNSSEALAEAMSLALNAILEELNKDISRF